MPKFRVTQSITKVYTAEDAYEAQEKFEADMLDGKFGTDPYKTKVVRVKTKKP